MNSKFLSLALLVISIFFARALQKNDLRLEGGYKAYPKQYPFAAAIFYNSKYICSGTLISRKWVLTAGSCLDMMEDKVLIVSLGGIKNVVQTEPGRHDVPSLKHYNLFGNETFINNIALLELAYEVTLTEYILPIQLPRSGSILQPRTEGTVLGFKDNYLHFGNVVSLWESECLAGGIEANLKYNLTFCTNNSQGNTVPCNDDLGSAILSRNEDGSYTQTGILISGGCYEKPSVFTRTEIYLPIISEITGIYLPRNK